MGDIGLDPHSETNAFLIMGDAPLSVPHIHTVVVRNRNKKLEGRQGNREEGTEGGREGGRKGKERKGKEMKGNERKGNERK